MRTLLTCLILAVVAQGAMADRVVCTYNYGGEARTLVAAPVASPYEVPAIAVGSYFYFRVVFQDRPIDLASIKVYVYSDRDSGMTPIHVAEYPYPAASAADRRPGFTGLHAVYEPMRDGELQYWCAMHADTAQ